MYEHSAKLFKIDNRIASDFARGATGGMCATLYAFLFNVIKSRQQAILDPVQSEQLARYDLQTKYFSWQQATFIFAYLIF